MFDKHQQLPLTANDVRVTPLYILLLLNKY
jgi:hypothetical protein